METIQIQISGIGENINQKIDNAYKQKIEEVLSDLKAMGILEEEILEVRNIVTQENNNKTNLGKKLLGWIGKITSKAIEKGIELNLPMIMGKIQELM